MKKNTRLKFTAVVPETLRYGPCSRYSDGNDGRVRVLNSEAENYKKIITFIQYIKRVECT